MSHDSDEFLQGATELATRRRRKLLGLRSAIGGLGYGISAYGSPIGNVSGVQSNNSSNPPVNPDQFGGEPAGEPAGDSGGSGGDSGGSV